MQEPFKTHIVDVLGKFIQTDTWRVIRHRLNLYIRRLNDKAVNLLITNDDKEASKYAYMAQGVMETIKIIERLPKEVQSDQIDADVALHVIENKGVSKETLWQKMRRKLGPRRKTSK